MKRIAVYSAAGGTGKSFVAANLASSLFRRGLSVVLCELCPRGLLTTHFGGDFWSDAGVSSSNQKGNAKQRLRNYSLHNDFTLLTPNPSMSSTPGELLLASVRKASELYGANGVIIVDIPTNIGFNSKSPLFTMGLEIVSADPVSVAAACSGMRFDNINNAVYRIAYEKYMVLNKKDLRSSLFEDSASLVEELFGDQLLGVVHYDSAVPEAFACKSLVVEHSPQCQAAADIAELTAALENLIRPLQHSAVND